MKSFNAASAIYTRQHKPKQPCCKVTVRIAADTGLLRVVKCNSNV